MAGRPRTRARQAAEAAAAAGVRIPDAEPLPTAQPGPNAHTHARVRPAPRMAMPGFVGAQTKATADNLEAERLLRVASQIRAGVTVQIERTRPTWCAGFLEDYPIDQDADAFAELRAYIRDTYGGQRYRLTVISSSGVTLADGSLPVAAPPRHFGEPIDRLRWQGDLSPHETTSKPTDGQTLAAPAASSSETLLGLVIGLVKDSNAATVSAVEKMTSKTAEQTKDLVAAVLKTRSEEKTERSITTQLGELVEVTRAVDKVQRQLFGAAVRNTAPEDPDAKAERESSQFFKKAVFGKVFGFDPATGQPSSSAAPGAAASRGQAQQRKRVSIPDAGPATARPNNGKAS